MISGDIRRQYTVTIGIECHVQFKTKTKLFSGADNDAREAAPNTLVNHIDFGLPGGLPVLNKHAVYLACRAAFALNSQPQKFSKFDRKHYFYPDLPMGYQITQFDEPIVLGGSVDIETDGNVKTIGITRAHMESDAGKSTHPVGADYSLVDLNRAGTPLLEIVSEPDMHAPAEAKAYARELYLRMKYADVSEANLYYGNMRFDVNVSVSKTDQLGTRTETKNLNSFRSVEKAAEFEINRQIEQLERGEPIVQETRGWDDTALKTFSQRTKEDAHDYRYMPDPDLPPIVLEQTYIDEIKANMPLLPQDFRKQLQAAGLDPALTETALDIEQSWVREFLQKVIAETAEGARKRILNWLIIDVQGNVAAGKNDWDLVKLNLDNFVTLAQMVDDNAVSSTVAKSLLHSMTLSGDNPKLIAEQQGLIQNSDEGEIAAIVAQVLAENAQAAEDVKNGETKAIGFLVGQVMKLSSGKANPSLASNIIKKQLGL